MSLTEKTVHPAQPQAKPYTLADTPKLFLYIAPNGTKSWHYRFSWDRKQNRISLGTYPQISLREAPGTGEMMLVN